jgi:trehalose-6-phosphatase
MPRVVSVLNDLANDPRNIVYVMSAETTSVSVHLKRFSLTPQTLEKLFVQSVNIGLIAENGGFIRPPGASTKKWLTLAKNADFSWREHVEQIFKYYQERTPGSSVSALITVR